ncbi:hypothetical protein HYQ46_013291 [Verticillium longisporum]|nr:hypothetical protein HYQ46_013291 [Verticillium longisporum]
MADIFHQTGDERWLTVAQRFDHASVFDPLAGNRDSLNGLHANTQVPKWIGAAREYKATGTTRYSDIARNAWNITVQAHTLDLGSVRKAEGGELDFEASSGGRSVKLGPFYEAHGFNYNVYWATSGDLTEA